MSADRSLLDRPAVRRVQEALRAANSSAEVIQLDETARSASDAAASIGCELGAIVKSLVFAIADQPVMALVAGDRQCNTKSLSRVLGLRGKCRRADAGFVRKATGFSIGGVAPLAHATKLPVAIDASLMRFATVYAAAGHPHCVFAIAPDELARVTGGRMSADIVD